MPKGKPIVVTKETITGRNVQFQNKYTGESMTLLQFISAIKNSQYTGYHIREINGVETPVSNPDNKKGNNLG